MYYNFQTQYIHVPLLSKLIDLIRVLCFVCDNINRKRNRVGVGYGIILQRHLQI